MRKVSSNSRECTARRGRRVRFINEGPGSTIGGERGRDIFASRVRLREVRSLREVQRVRYRADESSTTAKKFWPLSKAILAFNGIWEERMFPIVVGSWGRFFCL